MSSVSDYLRLDCPCRSDNWRAFENIMNKICFSEKDLISLYRTIVNNKNMTITKRIRVNKKVNSNNYSNNETGEVLSSELKDGSVMTVTYDTGNVELVCDDFVSIDSEALSYAIRVLKKEDVSRLVIMSNDLSKDENVVYNKVEPHDNETLQAALGFLSRSAYMAFIKRVTDLGFIYKLRGRIRNTPGRYVYKMNPYFARKNKTFKSEVVSDLRNNWD